MGTFMTKHSQVSAKPEFSNQNPLIEQDIAHHLHPRTDWRANEADGPLLITHADGCEIIDSDGKRYIEGMSGLWCAALGFNHSRLADAAFEQMNRLAYYHSFAHRATDKTVELATRLAALAPEGFNRVFFSSSGSEAVETMVKIAWAYHAAQGNPQRRKIISRMRSFHGSSIVTASMSGIEAMHMQFGLPLPGYLKVSCPDYYHTGQPGESEQQFVARLADELEVLIQKEGADTIAGFVAEPIQSGNAVVVPPEGYFPAIQKVLDRHGILLLDDEIVCGLGRAGSMFGCQAFGMKPDMMSIAKALSSSYFPISATIVSEHVYQVVADYENKSGFGHGFTNSGHPVGAAIALEALKIYEEMDVVSVTTAKGIWLEQALEQRFAEIPFVGDIRGRGLIWGLEIVADKATKRLFPKKLNAAKIIVDAAAEHGLMLRPVGDTIAICPPFIIRDEQLEALVDRLERAFTDVSQILAAEALSST